MFARNLEDENVPVGAVLVKIHPDWRQAARGIGFIIIVIPLLQAALLKVRRLGMCFTLVQAVASIGFFLMSFPMHLSCLEQISERTNIGWFVLH